jgi:glycine/D-amino acid oxidase-like deaminating enzyme
MVTYSADVAVVGAGTAGAAVAAFAAERGLSVVCIERRALADAGARWVNGVAGWMFDEAGLARPSGDELIAEGGAFHLIAGFGPWAPVSLGDYCAGSNHVLPTAGCACHSSGLSVRAFTKSVHVVDYSQAALAEVADHVVTLAEAEDLPGHGQAVSVRFEK